MDLSGVAPSIDLLASYEVIEVSPSEWFFAGVVNAAEHGTACDLALAGRRRACPHDCPAYHWQDMLSARHLASALSGATDQGAAQSVPGRTVLLVGEAARQRAGTLVETMQACGCQPAIVAALVPKHLGESLKGAAERVRCAMFRRAAQWRTS